jgi:hypothetical protein
MSPRGGAGPGVGGTASGSGGSSGSSGTSGRAGSAGSGGKGMSCIPSSASESMCADDTDDDCDGFVDCLDPDCEAQTCGNNATCLAGACLGEGTLPELPRIDNLVPLVRGDTAIIDFAPVLGAKDYRIYTLPDEDDVLVGPDGEVAVRNAVYRCSGAAPRENRAENAMKPLFPLSLAGNVEGFERSEADATLGYVFITPGNGRKAVYRVANPNSIGNYTWEYDAPPAKEYNGADYVDSVEERDQLLAQGWRDDGIAFYVAEDGTKPIYRREYESNGFVFFYADGPEKAVRDGVTAASGGERFKVLEAPVDGAVPLYRIRYGQNNDHDNLAAGDAMKERILYQGQTPVTSLLWSGLKGSTTLVIEALDAGCPFPNGYIGAMSAPGVQYEFQASAPTITLDDARLSSGEVFVNGQFDPSSRPKPIARAYVTVEPKDHPEMDWFERFDGDLGEVETLVSDGNGTRVFHTDKLSIEFIASDVNYSYGRVLDQFFGGSFASFALAARGANARLEDDTYLHATMSVDVASSGRRYPQIFITDTPIGDPAMHELARLPFIERLGPMPFQMLPPGPYHTIIAQVFGGSPELQIQFCDLRGWGVSQQCGRANIYGFHAGDANLTWEEKWLPLPVVGDYAGNDRLVKWDVYASTKRVYLFIEDRPAGCAVLPEGRMPAGPVNVIFGAAGYHIDVDEFVAPEEARHQYWKRYSLSHIDRKFDDLGVKSDATLPAWDESVIPCGTRYYGESPP